MPEKESEQQLRELIDACRPDHEDLAQPEMEPLAKSLKVDPTVRRQFQRSQQLDSAIACAFADVEVPEGLDVRILERLTQATEEDEEHSRVDLPGRRRGRRWMAVAAAVTGIAAVLLIALFAVPRPEPDSFSPQELAELALRWSHSEHIREGDWRSVRPAGLERYPVSSELEIAPSGWLAVPGSDAICYRVAVAGRPVYLYVLPGAGGPEFPSHPPRKPTYSGAGWSAAVWTSSTHRFALAFEGGERRYWELAAPTPIT